MELPVKTMVEARAFANTLSNVGDHELFLDLFERGEYATINGHFPAFYSDEFDPSPLTENQLKNIAEIEGGAPLPTDETPAIETETPAIETETSAIETETPLVATTTKTRSTTKKV